MKADLEKQTHFLLQKPKRIDSMVNCFSLGSQLNSYEKHNLIAANTVDHEEF